MSARTEPVPDLPSAAAAPATDGTDRPLTGILLLVGAMMLVPMMDGLAKHLSSDYTTEQIVWARYFFHLAFLLPLVLWRFGRQALAPKRPVAQILRGGLLLA